VGIGHKQAIHNVDHVFNNLFKKMAHKSLEGCHVVCDQTFSTFEDYGINMVTLNGIWILLEGGVPI